MFGLFLKDKKILPECFKKSLKRKTLACFVVMEKFENSLFILWVSKSIRSQGVGKNFISAK